MRSAHRNFDLLLTLGERLSRKVAFISEETGNRGRDYSWIPSRKLQQIAFQLQTVWEMTQETWRARDCEVVFIFEHKPWYAYPVYAVCLARRQTVLFIVHGIQQTHGQSFFHRMGLRVLRLIERHADFWPVHLEVSDRNVEGVPRFTKSIVMPHPMPREAQPRGLRASPGAGGVVRIGILGILRADKPVEPLLDILARHAQSHAGVELVFGSPRWQVPESLQEKLKARGIVYRDTDTMEQYNAVVHSLHIVVAWFDRDAFYFRPSGIVHDAIAGGCYVLAPDFPVIAAQMSTPVRCGSPCKSLDELPAELERAMDEVRHAADLQARFDAWRAYRSDERVLDSLCLAIDSALSGRARTVQPSPSN